MTYYHALIRTHHITSRKKVSALKSAAQTLNVFALLRSGGCPGIMYVEAKDKDAVESWVSVVRNLRYKDFQLVSRPACVLVEEDALKTEGKGTDGGIKRGEAFLGNGLDEVESVKEFGSLMAQRGVWQWWRKGMGYARGD
ncbi:uncharacterized protein DSM5745_09710 [Aspergillus mulundensis]|uniref:Uncharacterized protein n=1 Tax=Aspergillus mulundensis TaxID=1810919 RepID=A0A3D8QR66_9EURO|nr:Uncharacterized protein DSM5745_09710 [Aspergillus mulundensis]RDW64299.1 Uncharacterized protein DSM5745_09710 [Aspergillus mulundensis]